MKHIFIAHSHSLFLSVLGVIDFLKLKEDEVIIIYTRKYSNSLIKIPYQTIDLSLMHEDCKTIVRNREQRNKTIKEFDTLLDQLVSDNYIAYVPHLTFPMFQILVTNSKCSGFHYVQEGAIAFKSAFFEEKSIQYFIQQIYNTTVLHKKRIWKSTKWTIPTFLKNARLTETFAISSEIFKYLPRKNNLITWPELPCDYELNVAYPCFIFESIIEMKAIEPEIYFAAIDQLIRENASEFNYVKFHPNQSIDNREVISNLFRKNNVNMIELPMDIPFEIFLSKFKSLKVCGFDSSLLFLAEQLNHIVITGRENLLVSSMYRKWHSQLF